MKVAVFGTGDVGRALGHGFIDSGHAVMMGSRAAGNDKARDWVARMGANAAEGSFADAARFGEIAVFAVRGTAVGEVAAAVGDALDGKVVIDATNPLDFSAGFPPTLAISGNDSGGETLQRALPKARVVKAFNIVPNALMYRPDLPGGPPTMLIAGEDADAKAAVTTILDAFGWETIDLGGIRSSRWLEAMCVAWVMAASATESWNSAFKLLRG